MFSKSAKKQPEKNLNSCLFKGELDDAKELLAQGIDINKADEFGIYAIAGIIESGWPQSLRFFILSGGNINQDTGNGWTALHIAFDLAIDGMLQTMSDQPDDKTMEMIRILLGNGADLNFKNKDGETPLDILNSYSANIEGFNVLKTFFRDIIPDIDTRIEFHKY